MPLIDNTYFRIDISLTLGTYNDVDLYIGKFEKEVLINLLGYTDYTEMMSAFAALPGTPLPEKWDALINGKSYIYGDETLYWNGLINSDKVSFIAYYVYCRYLQAKQSQSSGAGVVTPKNENSNVVDGIPNFVNSWNHFVELYDECQFFMSKYGYDYGTNAAQYGIANLFGI